MMKDAVIYFGGLNSDFARKQEWLRFSLGIFASGCIDLLQKERKIGLKIYSYMPKDDSLAEKKIACSMNDGIFLDYALAPNKKINGLADILHKSSKKLAVNTGWGMHNRLDYGKADIVLLESFIGTNSGDDGKWPVTYFKTDVKTDVKKLRNLVDRGYEVIALSYGPPNYNTFARYCQETARDNGAHYFIYTQAPGWEKEGSGFRLFHS